VPPNWRVVEPSAWEKMLEYPGLRLGRDADAGILYAQADGGRFVRLRLQPDAHHDFTLFGELDRIADQVAYDLAQPERIAAQAHADVGWEKLAG